MFVELIQGVMRTIYRAMGGREIEHEREGSTTGGFVFQAQGEPQGTVVLVHGLGDASTAWQRLVPRLREEVRVVAPDLAPFGLSELDGRPAQGPDEHARDVAEVIETHAVGETTLVGQSLGGWTCQWLLYQRPELVDQAVLVAPAGAHLEGSYDAMELLTPHTRQGVLEYLDALWYERPPGVEAIAGAILERMHGPEIRGFLALTDEEHTLDDKQLGSIETPTRVVWGHHDELLDARTPAYLAKRWGGPVDRSYLARAGHMVQVERPEALGAIIRDVAGIEPR